MPAFPVTAESPSSHPPSEILHGPENSRTETDPLESSSGPFTMCPKLWLDSQEEDCK
jgi:hypothetical protein